MGKHSSDMLAHFCVRAYFSCREISGGKVQSSVCVHCNPIVIFPIWNEMSNPLNGLVGGIFTIQC